MPTTLKPQILAIANQKGGVGKTTTAVNLGASLAAKERKTLIIDADSQANASSSLGYGQGQTDDQNLYRLLAGECSFQDVVVRTELDFLDLLPGHADLVGIEVEWADRENRESVLSKALKGVISDYEFVLIDCPPALSIMTINALTAANAVLIPLQSEYLAMEGLSHLLNTIELIQEHYNLGLSIYGVLLTMHDARNRLAREVEREVREHFQSQAFEVSIPRNVRLGEAPSFGKPVVLHDIQCRGATSYLRLADEVIARAKRQTVRPNVTSSEGAHGAQV